MPQPRDKAARPWWQNIKVIGGLIAVGAGLLVVLIISVLALALTHDHAAQAATIAGSAFTVIGTLVGAYFGVKVGTDQAETAMGQTREAMRQTEVAVRGMRAEAARAVGFALHVRPDETQQAIADARALGSDIEESEY